MMKKVSILIAVFAVIAGTTPARSEGINIDFDKGTFEYSSFMEAVQSENVCGSSDSSCGRLTSVPTEIALGSEKETYNGTMFPLNGEAKQKLRGRITKSANEFLDKKTIMLLNNEKIDILYNKTKVLFITDLKNNSFTIASESLNSWLIALIDKIDAEQFSTRMAAQYSSATKVFEHGQCISSHIEKKCGYRMGCSIACGAAGGAASGGGVIGAIIGGAAAACIAACQNIDDCRDVSVCYQYAY